MKTFTFKSSQSEKNSQLKVLNSSFDKVFGVNGLNQLLLLLVFVMLSSGVWGATKTWTNGNGNSRWTTAANWTGGVPAGGDDIVIPIGAAITRVPNLTINSLSVSQNVSLTANSPAQTLTINNTSGATSLYVASGRTLTMGDGTANNAVNLTLTAFGVASNIAGNIAMTANTTLAVQTTILNITGNLSGAGNVTMSSGVINIGGNFTTSGTFTSGSGTVNYNGTGAQQVRGGNYNNLVFTNSSTKTLQAASNVAAALTINAGSTFSLSTFTLGATTPPTSTILYCGAPTGSSITGTGLLTLGGNVNIIDLTTGSDDAKISCPVSLGATRIFTVANDGTSASDLTVSGAISGNTYGVTKLGLGTLILSGANTYTGATNVNDGTLKAGSATQAFGVGSAVTLANTAGVVLDVTGFNNTIGSLNGGGTTGGDVILGAATLTIGSNNLSTDFAGVISGTGAITKTGTLDTGILTLSGTNTYSGLTTISRGTLKINNTAALGATTNGTTITSGGVLDLNGINYVAAEALTINGTGILSGGAFINSSVLAGGYSAAITLGSASSIGTTGDITLGSNGITGTQDLTKVGAGTLALGSGTSNLNSLTVNSGTLLSTSGNLNIAGSLTNNSAFTHNSGTVIFTGSAAALINGSTSTNFDKLTINKTVNGVTLGVATSVASTLSLSGMNLSLSNYDLTLGASALVSGSFDGTHMIDTNGAGRLEKQSTTTAGFNITYPVGTGSLYNPMILSSVTGSVAGTASVFVRAVSGIAPNTATTDLKKHWIVSTTGLTLASTDISFGYVNPTDVGGVQSEYALRYSTTPAVSWSAPNTPSASGVNPMTTTGSTVLDGTWTAREVSQTWYSLRSGNWNDPTVWTLDPAGSLIDNPGNTYPQLASDNIVVKNGKTITMNVSSLTCKNLTVEGSLDLGSTSGHTFTTINGNGRILLSSNNWPSGDATNFTTAGQGEGTTVFYGNSFSLTSARTFYNMEVMMTAGQTVTLMSDFTLNNNLEVKTGTFKINDDIATAIRTLIVKGNVSVSSGASITTGLGKTNGLFNIPGTMPASGNYHSIYHKFEMWGDFTNDGTVRFTNQATNAPVYNQFTNSGAVSVWFKGLTNNTATCNGTTDFYNLIVDKGTDQTYTLELNASSTANFALYGPNSVGRNEGGTFSALNPEIRKALWIYNGTLKLTGNISIPTLSEGDNAGGNGDYAIGGNACLWIASANVAVYSTADNASQVPASAVGVNTGSSNQALSVYGKYRISAGTFATRSSAGLIFWSTANAVLSIEGGTTTVAQFRSAASGTGQTSYLQSGGLLKVDGIGEVTNGFPLFGFDSSDGVFVMSAGEIQVLAESGNANDIYLPITDGNYNTTGGKLTISVNGNTTVDFNSNVLFYNVDISRLNAANTAVVSLKTSLKVLGTLTLGNNSTLTSNNFDVSIGKDFTTGSTASTYTAGTNTTTFNGAQNSIITNAAALSLNKLVINKSAHSTEGSFYEVALAGAGQLSVSSDLTLTLGALNTGSTSPNVAGNIAITSGLITSTVAGVPSTGKLVLNGGVTQNLSGSGLNFGSITLNNGNNGAALLSDIIVKDLVFNAAGTAKVNMGVYNLSVSGTITNSAATRYMYGAGNASDGGLSLFVNANGAKIYPIGVSGKYTPAAMTVSGYSDDGYITVIPVNTTLLTTDPAGGIIMPYYWKTNYNSFTTLPSVIYTFTYAETDNTGYYPGKVLDVTPYTRSYINNVAKVDEAANTIIFDTPFTLEKANYTAGATARFIGSVVHYYSKGGDWNTTGTWDKNSKGSATHEVPLAGSIVHIYNTSTASSGRVNCTAVIPNAPAEIIFEHDYTTYPVPNSETVPRLQFWATSSGVNVLGRVTGTGMISIGGTGILPLTGDFGDFGTNLDSYYMFFGGVATNLSGIPTPIPNLLFEYSTTINQSLIVNSDFIIQGGATVSPLQNVDIKRDLAVGMWTGGIFQFQEATPAVTVTVGRNIDFTNNPSGTLGTRTIVCQSGTATNVEHRLIVKGNIIHGVDNGSIFDLYNGATNRNRVVLELAGTGVHNYSRSSTAVPDFYQIVMNKGVDQSNSFTFNQHFTIYSGGNNTATKSITMQNGTLALNSANFTTFNLTSGGANFAIPSTSALQLTLGTYTANGTSGIDLDGLLKINGATASLDMSGGDNPIVFGAGGSSTIDISAGTLTVGGQIRRATNSEVGVLKYYQSGGSVYVGRNTTGATTRGTFEVMGTGSVLNISAGDLYVERAASASLAGLYLMPTTTNLAANNTIHIGSSTVGGQTVGVYSTPSLQNLDVLNGSTAKLMIVPLTLSGTLSIASTASTTFNANGLALNIGGNFVNNGIFTHGNNTTTFNGSGAQSISGATASTFYNLTKLNSNTLTTSTSTTVANDLTISSGILADNSNTVNVKGDFTVDGTHQYGGAGKGILMDNASAAQNIRGNGTIGMLTVNNSRGINVPIGNLLTISNNLRLEAGVFNIDKNLLTLGVSGQIIAGNAFSASNMIQTNVSFTDNGVKKVFPSGASGTFVYPVGSGGKYTPVTFNITGNGNSTGSIIIKPAAEYHPSVLDAGNVLAYYWTVMSSGISGFTASATLKYDAADVAVTGANTEANYIAARLLSDGLGVWNKFDETAVDETNHQILFTYAAVGDAEISGDYTAGINTAIPDKVQRFESTKDGDWTDVSVWSLLDPDTGVPGAAGVGIPIGGPRGSIATVKHVVTSTGNGISSYNTILSGSTSNLIVGSTYGHRLGIASGNGILTTSVGDLPAADYSLFFASTGGTLEYNGSSTIDILTDLPTINSLKLSGTGTRTLPNINFQLLGNLTIAGPIVTNDTYDKTVRVKGNITFDSGTFTAGNLATAKLVMNGTSAQTIGGLSSFTTTTNDFNHFEINNSAGVVLAKPLDISGNLTLTSGNITTTSTNILKMTTASATASVGSSSSYVDGPMIKQMTSGGSFSFPLGNATRFGSIYLETVGVSGLWKAQYFNNSPDVQGLTTTSFQAPVKFVSTNEYWNVLAPSATTATATLRWDGESGVNPADVDMRGVQWITDKWNEVTLTSLTGNGAAGTGKTASALSFNANGGGNYITFGATVISAYTWIGAVDTDWFNTGNWSTGIIPSASTNTTIPNTVVKPVVSGAVVAQTNGLTINNSATLTVGEGGRLTVGGALNNLGTLVVKNTPLAMASVITNGTITAAGTTRVDNRMPKSTRYWYYGLPVNGALVKASVWDVTNPHTSANKHLNGAWVKFTNNNDLLANNSLPGFMNGYAVRLTGSGDTTLVAQGTFNNGDIQTTIPKYAWGLVCNPYLSYIDMGAVYAATTSDYGSSKIKPTIWVPTNATGSTVFATYNLELGTGSNGGSKILAPTQAFWIANNDPSNDLVFTMKQSARIHNSTTVLKSISTNEEASDIFRIELVGATMTDETVMVFRDGGVEELTGSDSEKRINTGVNSCNIYTVKSGKSIAISKLPLIENSYSVPLSYTIGTAAAGSYSIVATNLSSFDSSLDVYLEDVLNGVSYNLRDQNNVTVSLLVGTNSNRFVLHFEPNNNGTPTVLPEVNSVNDASNITIQQLGNDALVTIPGDVEDDARIELYGLEGQLIRVKRGVDKATRIKLPEVKAGYIIKVINGNHVVSGKVVSR